MKQLLFLISFFLLERSPNGYAQVVSQRIQPSDLPPFLQTIASDNIPFFALQPIDKGVIEKFAEEDKISGRAPHFGQSRLVDIGLNAGSWHYSDAGRVWTMGVTSSGAKGFMVVFDKLVLAENATLYLFNKNRNMLVGAIDATANNPNQIFSSDLVEGDSVIIALIEPPMNFGKTQLHISHLLYAYQLPYVFNVADNPIPMLNCHRDVSCPEGTGREDISRTVALIFDPIGGRWCSGSMLNNSCNDLRPTFFTAFHCADFDENRILSQNEITRVNNWVFRFGYKTATCGGADNRDWQSISSCNLIAPSESTDGILLELLNKPKASSGIAYAGWTTQTNNISQLVSLHHPQGNPMKISLDNQAPIFTTVRVGDATGTRLLFTLFNAIQAVWDIGGIENGSSGAPYFDQNQRVVAQHSASRNSCDNRTASGGTIAAAFNNFRSVLAENTGITQTNLSPIPRLNMPNNVCSEVPLQILNFPNVPNGWRFADNGLNLSGGNLSVGFFNGSWTLTFVPQPGYSGPGFVEFKYLQYGMTCSNPLVVRSDFWVGAPRSRVVLEQETDIRSCRAWLTVANPQPSFTYHWKITQEGTTYFVTGSSVLLRRRDQDPSVIYELTTSNSCQSQTDWGVESLKACNSWKAKEPQNGRTEMPLELSPNPVRNELNIQCSPVHGDLWGQFVQMEVSNLSGQRVHTQKIPLERFLKLDVSDWTNGFYILTLKGNGFSWHQKFYVNQN